MLVEFRGKSYNKILDTRFSTSIEHPASRMRMVYVKGDLYAESI